MEEILIIDDEKPTLAMFRLLLGAYGYNVVTAENGASGIDIFKRQKPHIVFTDIKMPGMDGMTVLKTLKAIDPEVQVIVMTGHGDKALAEQALDLAATTLLHKPIQRDKLDEALKLVEEQLALEK